MSKRGRFLFSTKAMNLQTIFQKGFEDISLKLFDILFLKHKKRLAFPKKGPSHGGATLVDNKNNCPLKTLTQFYAVVFATELEKQVQKDLFRLSAAAFSLNTKSFFTNLPSWFFSYFFMILTE